MAALSAQEQIIAILREQLPVGVLSSNNESVTLWLGDAAEIINARRRKSTVKEVSLSLVAGTQTYDLPADCESVEQVLVEGLNPLGDNQPFSQSDFPDPYGGGPLSMLPTGQRYTGGIDLMRRQEATRANEEVRWRYLAGKLVLDFQITQAVTARVSYIAPDRSVESLPKRFWDMCVTYLHWKAASAFLFQAAGTASQSADRLMSMNIGAIESACRMKKAEWESAIAGVTSEVD